MKRISIVVLLLWAGFVSEVWAQQPAAKVRDWAQFHRRNMERSTPYEHVLNVHSVGGLELKWNFTTGRGVWSSPAIVDGVVYFGSEDHNVYALNARTGAKLWSYTTGNQVYSPPAVVHGTVYIGSDDGNVYALNARTGTLLWKHLIGDYLLAAPTIVNGVAYIGAWDSNVYALNAHTGAKLWSYHTGS